MKDQHITTDPALSPAEAAVSYLLQRVRVDADLRHHLVGTEAFERLCSAEAARTGKTPDQVERDLLGLAPAGTPRLVVLRRAVGGAVDIIRSRMPAQPAWLHDLLDELERLT